MANYHFTGKVHSRLGDTANNAVRAAAYRAGCILQDANGNTYNYTKKSEVQFSAIFAPKGAPDWVYDRSKLWNAVEASEKRVDAQLFREFEGALPNELTLEQNEELVREFTSKAFISEGMICDANIHMKPGNGHVHMSLSMRHLLIDGFGAKNRDWNDKALIEKWRKLWADTCNKHLELAGSEKRIDHRSYKEQGLDIEPTVHLGPKHSRTYESRVARNKNIKEYNEDKIILESNISKLSSIEKTANDITLEIKRHEEERVEAKLIRASFLKDLHSVSSTININTGVSLNPKNFSSLKAVHESKSTALSIYEPPEIILDRYNLNYNYNKNFPTRAKDQQACFALRELLGNDAEKEYNNRVKMMNLAGAKYSWSQFYTDIQKYRNNPTGAYESWWRTYARMAYNTHNDTFEVIRNEVPKKYLNIIDSEVIKEIPKNRVEKPAYNYDFINQLKDIKSDANADAKNTNYSDILRQIHEYNSKSTNKPASEPRTIIRTPEPESTPDVPPQQHEDVVAPAYYNPYPDPYRIPDTPRPPWGSDTPSPW